MTRTNHAIVLGLILYGAVSSVGRELPKLECENPTANERMDPGASFGVTGRVSVPLITTVGIQIYHIHPDGKVLRHFGVSGVKTSENGQFHLNIQPPPGGWLPGKQRIVCRLDAISQVTIEREFEVKALPRQRPMVPEYLSPAKSSGVTVDSYREPKRRRSIPFGNLFLVRGEFELIPPANPMALGPSTIGKIGMAGVTMNSATARSLWDPITKKYWFELQLRAPNQTGEATLSIEFDKVGEDGKRQRESIKIPLSITDEDPLAIVGPGGM